MLKTMDVFSRVRGGRISGLCTAFSLLCLGALLSEASWAQNCGGLDIQEELDKVSAGGVLSLPAGVVCEHSATLLLNPTGGNSCGNFLIEGNGATLKSTSMSGEGGLKIENCHGFEVRNLTIQDHRASSLSGYGSHNLVLRRSTRGTLKNVRSFESAGSGFFLKGFTLADNSSDEATREIRMIGCAAEKSWADGLTLVDAEDVQVIGGRYAESAGLLDAISSGSPVAAGIRIETHKEHELIDGVWISGATIEGNSGAGIHITQNSGGITRNIQIEGSRVSNNDRSALRIRGSAISFRGNQVYGQSLASNSEAVVRVLGEGLAGDPLTRSVIVAENDFQDIETGLDVVLVEAGVVGARVSDNTFRSIHLSAVPHADCSIYPGDICSVVSSEAHDMVIRGNQFFDVGQRGISSRGERGVIEANILQQMSANVIFLNGSDTRFSGNTIGPLRSAGDGSADEAIVRSKKDGGSVSGNSAVCADTTQRAFYFDASPLLALGNTVTLCKDHLPDGWARFPSGATTLQSANVQTKM